MIPKSYRNLKVLSQYLNILILIQQEKNSFSISFSPLSGLNIIKMKTEILIQQGTIRTFNTPKLTYSHHILKQMLNSDLKKTM